jgi:hypothetical protein
MFFPDGATVSKDTVSRRFAQAASSESVRWYALVLDIAEDQSSTLT